MRDLVIRLVESDRRLRAKLLEDGELNLGYHPRMRQLHEANARELELLIDDEGWPSVEETGEDGCEAAFIIALHAISRPAFQRRCLTMMKAAASRGDIPARHPAVLEDRIRTLEGKPQLYGTLLDWDEAGQLSPLPVEDADSVDARRDALGLPPLAEAVETARANAAAEGAQPPADWQARQQALEEFVRAVGWR